MKTHYDFKNEWEKTKKQLIKISRQATEVAKQGEKELIKISKRGKLHIDATAASLKKEKLYYEIGKEYVNLKDPSDSSPKLKQLILELKKVDQGKKVLQRKLNPPKMVSKNNGKNS